MSRLNYTSVRPYGAALLTFAALTLGGVSPAPAKSYTETVLTNFMKTNGWIPAGGLVSDKKGNFYGVTSTGGAHGNGTLFELTPSGNLNTLWDFSGSDGANPGGSPLLAGHVLYGTTDNGGANSKGVIYAYDLKTKQMSDLFDFDWSYGVYPLSAVIRDKSGNLYGVTRNGGAYGSQCDGAQGCGVVFELSSTGTYTVLYSFSGSDGATPMGGLIMDAAGNLYGTTQDGGANGYGSVFEVTPAGQETTLYNFPSTGPHQPMGSLVMDASGNLYGTAFDGGGNGCSATGGCGGLFELDASGNFSVLYQFEGGSDGASPAAGMLCRNGKLYGTTSGNGATGSAFAFDLAKSKLNVLYDFADENNGLEPSGMLLRSGGNFFGMTEFGGTGDCSPYAGCGVIYELSRAAK